MEDYSDFKKELDAKMEPFKVSGVLWDDIMEAFYDFTAKKIHEKLVELDVEIKKLKNN